MRRFLLLLLLPFLSCTLFAQIQRGLKGEYDIGEYPEVSFVWNTPDPSVLDKNAFTLTDENDQKIDFGFSVLPIKDTCYKKSVLFLWEDMISHSNQSENTRKLLVDFFKKTTFDQSTVFNVAVFNRKSDLENSVLNPLMTKFSSKTNELADAVSQYKKSTRIYNEYPQATDLYSAIDEGINLLKKESDRVGIIVVVTAGLNLKAAGATTEMGHVLKNAKDAGVPIYVVKYHQFAGNASEVDNLTKSTYGQTILLTDKMVDKAVIELQRVYKNLDANCSGQDYKFTFTTTAQRDGKSHLLHLSVNKTPQLIPPFTAPSMTFGLWVKEHIVLFILLLLLLAGLIVVAVWLIMRGIKIIRKRESENQAQLQQEIDKANQERANWMNLQKQKEEAKQLEEVRKAQEEEKKRLLQLMHVKNMYPRLQCDVNDSVFTYTINQIATKIGRNENNDVVLSSNTVSGVHAEIRFNGTSFDVVNKSQSYSQGIVVNGQLFQQCTLKNGDMIGLGEAIITFYV